MASFLVLARHLSPHPQPIWKKKIYVELLNTLNTFGFSPFAALCEISLSC